FRLGFLRANQRGQGFRQTGKIMGVALFFFALDRFPLFEHGASVARLGRAEHMWMSPDKFGRHVVNDLLNVEAAGFTRDLRVHLSQQQKTAAFRRKLGSVVGARALRHFIRLFDERWQQRLVGLLTIPRATAGVAKFCDNLAELRKIIGDLWSIIRHREPLRMYNSSLSTDPAGIQCRLTTIALCSSRDSVR